MPEPANKKVVAFFDCQNLFHACKNLWNYSYPNFDPVKLSQRIVHPYKTQGWKLINIQLYTGIHEGAHNLGYNQAWRDFWLRKLAAHQKQDSRVGIFTVPLRYAAGAAREKGIDVRIALDLVRMARLDQYDVALLFSQDNDFEEAAKEIRVIAQERKRWIKIASTFPHRPANPNDVNFTEPTGVRSTDWIKINKIDYDACLDSTDYRSVI